MMPEEESIKYEVRLATARIRKEYEPRLKGIGPADAAKLRREMKRKIWRASFLIEKQHPTPLNWLIR